MPLAAVLAAWNFHNPACQKNFFWQVSVSIENFRDTLFLLSVTRVKITRVFSEKILLPEYFVFFCVFLESTAGAKFSDFLHGMMEISSQRLYCVVRKNQGAAGAIFFEYWVIKQWNLKSMIVSEVTNSEILNPRDEVDYPSKNYPSCFLWDPVTREKLTILG